MQQKRPGTIFWIVYILFVGLSLWQFEIEYKRVRQITATNSPLAEIVARNSDPVVEVISRILGALIPAFIVSWPTDAYRRHQWKKKQPPAPPVPDPKLLDNEPDDGQLPDMTRK